MKKKPAVGVAAIVIKNGKVLLGKRKGAHGAGSWAFPGGHLEFNESVEMCATREIFEETGLSVKNPRFVTMTNDLFHESDKHYVTLFVVCEYKNGDVEIKEPDKCEQWDWFYWNDFPSPIFLSLKNLLDREFIPPGVKAAMSPPEKLHRMTADQVAALGISGNGRKQIKNHSHTDLMEAAFLFENQLMELLGDVNPISYEIYSDLSHTQLAEIIINCTEQICRIHQKE